MTKFQRTFWVKPKMINREPIPDLTGFNISGFTLRRRVTLVIQKPPLLNR